jgi:hypothetical protein
MVNDEWKGTDAGACVPEWPKLSHETGGCHGTLAAANAFYSSFIIQHSTFMCLPLFSVPAVKVFLADWAEYPINLGE